MNILDYFINKTWPNDLEISLQINQVTFKLGDAYEYLAPIVYLSDDSDNFRVLGVGTIPEGSEKFIRVNLFDGKSLNSESINKSRALEAFFAYGISKMMNRRAFIRPRVSLIYGDNISNVFGGYEKMIFKQAVVNAGAREVVFSQTPQVV